MGLKRRSLAITHARLLEALHYDPKTGIFTNRIERPRCKVGAEAGCEYGPGYRVIVLDGMRSDAHRWAWFYMTGAWPDHEVDHKDLNRRNNRWGNLRAATHKQNLENQPQRRRFLPNGVRLLNEKWVVSITHRQKQHYIGSYEDLAEAVHIRQAAERLVFTHGRATSC